MGISEQVTFGGTIMIICRARNQKRIMKWNIITHNIQGLNDPDSIAKERSFLSTLTLRLDVVMIQKHKLRGKAMNNIGVRLMPGCAN